MKTGVFQCAGAGLTPARRLAQLSDTVGDLNLDMVVCPELFMSGYHAGDDVTRYAEPANGPCMQSVGQLAAAAGALFVYGYPELDGGLLYNSAACIPPEGKLLANHRKRLNSPDCFEEALSLRYLENADAFLRKQSDVRQPVLG